MNSLKGDVSSTLLELLNPEQSKEFRDSYLDIEFDFSECIFICTSNSVANMLGPLLDRIEMINVPAYLPIEKLNIAKEYLIPDLQKEYNFQTEVPDVERVDNSETASTIEPVPAEAELQSLAPSNEKVSLTDASIMDMINHYCHHEAGVRNLKKALDRVFRKIVAKLENQPETEKTEEKAEEVPSQLIEYQINTKNLETFLDIPPTDDSYYIGINK